LQPYLQYGTAYTVYYSAQSAENFSRQIFLGNTVFFQNLIYYPAGTWKIKGKILDVKKDDYKGQIIIEEALFG
jgi:hypothetical protein